TFLLATHNAECVAKKLSNSTGTTLRTLKLTAKLKSEFPRTFRSVALSPNKPITPSSAAGFKLMAWTPPSLNGINVPDCNWSTTVKPGERSHHERYTNGH